MANRTEERYIRYYTDGTAARKVEVYQPSRKTSLPKVRKKKVRVIAIDPVAIGGVVLSIVMLVMMLSSVTQLGLAQERLQQMTDYLYELESENAVLASSYQSQIDLEQVEERALALGMIPIEEAQHITIQVSPPVEEAAQEELTLWQEICTYFEVLFA